MDLPEIPQRPDPYAGNAGSLEEQIRSLRSTVAFLLIACCCLGAGFGLFLWRQVAQMKFQVVESQRAVIDYNSNALPRIRWFVNNLQTFAKTNPDFNPILAKYGLLPTNLPPATPAPGTTVPGAKK